MLLGSKRNFLKISKSIGSQNFEFVKNSNQEEYNKILGRDIKGIGKTPKSIIFTFICEFEVNKYNDIEKGQIRIIDMEYTSEKQNKRRFF